MSKWKISVEGQAEQLISSIELDAFKIYFYTHTNAEIYSYFHITNNVLYFIINKYQVPVKTQQQINEINKRNSQSNRAGSCHIHVCGGRRHSAQVAKNIIDS